MCTFTDPLYEQVDDNVILSSSLDQDLVNKRQLVIVTGVLNNFNGKICIS